MGQVGRCTAWCFSVPAQLWCRSFPWEVQTKFGVAPKKGWISQWLWQFWWGTHMMINRWQPNLGFGVLKIPIKLQILHLMWFFGCGSTPFDFWVATFNQQNIEPASSNCFFGSNTGVGHYLWCSNLRALYEHPMFYNGDDQGSGHLRTATPQEPRHPWRLSTTRSFSVGRVRHGYITLY